jgi:hypothetical protein
VVSEVPPPVPWEDARVVLILVMLAVAAQVLLPIITALVSVALRAAVRHPLVALCVAGMTAVVVLVVTHPWWAVAAAASGVRRRGAVR